MKNFSMTITLLIILALPLTSSAHYIAGIVNDAKDFTSANNRQVILWNPSNGASDNLTDTIGIFGNSGTNNFYMFDCELLASPCGINNQLKITVLNSGDNYISEETTITITGAGYDLASNLTLNSPPTTTTITPENNYNSSQTTINFNCSAQDLDSNLKNISLYGNWSGVWEEDETKEISGSQDSEIFTKTLGQGKYQWACISKDNLSISTFSENNTLTIDTTPPIISLISLNQTSFCGINQTINVNCSATDFLLSVDSVVIQANSSTTSTTYNTQLISGDTYSSEILINEIGIWNFTCIANDTVGNNASITSENILANPFSPDLTIYPSSIIFSKENPLENEIISINATIQNLGCQDSDNFLAGFFENSPYPSGEEIENQTVSISGLSNLTITTNWQTKIGTTNIFISLDLEEIISEGNETNNYGNQSIEVNSWQIFYGNLSTNKILARNKLENLSEWDEETNITGNIYVTDIETNINWLSLQAIGKDIFGQDSSNDFQEIDLLLQTTNFKDSIEKTFTLEGNPKELETFTVQSTTIQNVPIINSSESTKFITGILWDTSDDKDNEFSEADNEDLIFIVKINQNQEGAYGLCDYEINIPVKLREQQQTDKTNIYFYHELN